MISIVHQTLESKPADGNGGSSQKQLSEELNLQSDDSHNQCQESNGTTKKAKWNDIVESIDIGSSHSGEKFKEKRSPRQKKRDSEASSFGIFLDTQLRKITNQKYRDETERDLLRLLLNRIENEPVKLKIYHHFHSRFIEIFINLF